MNSTINGEAAESCRPNTRGHTVVLLVDTQSMVGEAMRKMLADEKDIEFHYCQDPHQAIIKANEINPTVILQDLNLYMPDMDGFITLKAYRDNPTTSGTPIIILSLKDDPNDKRRAFELGASDYLIKLPDRIEIVARIRAHSKTYLMHLKREQEYQEMKNELNQLKAATCM